MAARVFKVRVVAPGEGNSRVLSVQASSESEAIRLIAALGEVVEGAVPESDSAPLTSSRGEAVSSDTSHKPSLGFPIVLMWMGTLIPLCWIAGVISGALRVGKGADGWVYGINLVLTVLFAFIVMVAISTM